MSKSTKSGMVSMTDVESSTVNRVGFQHNTKDLFVEYKSGSTYVYAEVPQTVFVNLTNADSVGHYLNDKIKGTYEFAKVDTD